MKKYTYDTTKYRFRELVSEVFEEDNLEKRHEVKKDWIDDNYQKLNIHNENTTKFHEVFYKRLNSDWTEFYDYEYNILSDYNFFSQVIHKTNGGQLPFIFQPDSSYANPDGFAICKLDMKEFKFEQVANGVYNIKLKIREVW